MICLQFLLICIISWIGFLLSSEPNYYKILGVSKTSGVDEIKKQYRKLAKKYHPDKNKNDPNAETKFISITKAYEILSDSQQRAIYDQEQSFSSGRFGSHQDPMRRWQGQGQYSPDVDDIVRGFQNFGFQQHNEERRRRSQQPQQEYEQEFETYAFMGPDGRIYYQQRPIRRQKRYTYQSSQSIDLTDLLLSFVIWPIFNLLLLIFACTTCCRLCISSSDKETTFQPSTKNTTNNTNNTTTNTTTNTTNTNNNRVLVLPKLSIQHIQETGVIVIVGMNTYSIQILSRARKHFQYDDKLLFCQFPYQHLMNMSQKEEAMEASDQKLLTYFQSIQSSFPSTMINCLIALTKEGKKYNICSKVFVPHSLSSSDFIEDENYVLEWILQVLEGQRTWQTKS